VFEQGLISSFSINDTRPLLQAYLLTVRDEDEMSFWKTGIVLFLAFFVISTAYTNTNASKNGTYAPDKPHAIYDTNTEEIGIYTPRELEPVFAVKFV